MVAAQRVNIADEYSNKDVASNQVGKKSKEDDAVATETVLQLLKVAHEGITEVFVWGDEAIGHEQKNMSSMLRTKPLKVCRRITRGSDMEEG